MTNTSTSQTISVLRQLFARYGLPQQMVSDNGPQFASEEFATFTKANGIRHTRCAPYHPSSNGAVERFVQTCIKGMQASMKDGLPLQHCLANFLLTYRATLHTTTGVSPATLFLGRDVRTRLDLIKPHINKRVCINQTRQKLTTTSEPRFRILVSYGQELYRSGSKWISATLTQQDGPLSFTVCMTAVETTY